MSWTIWRWIHVQVLLWLLKRREGTTMLHRGYQTRCCHHNRGDDRRPFRKLSTMFRWGGKGWQVTFNLMVKDNLNNLSLWCLRFFFATQGIEDMNDLPCCNRKERRRLANATDCGQKPYHNRILGGIVSKVGEGRLNFFCYDLLSRNMSSRGIVLFWRRTVPSTAVVRCYSGFLNLFAILVLVRFC